MLIELRVRDFAVIDDLSLELKSGLNVLSGETGAGKSIIVGALSLLVGERASSRSVRKGAEKAVVEAAFDVEGLPGLQEKLEGLGLPSDGGVLILRREVAREGRNRAWVNGSPATAAAVGELGARLVDIHGQHEHQSLLRIGEQREILDTYGGAEDLSLQVRALHGKLSSFLAELERKRERLQELKDQSDFLRFQKDEIDGAELRAGEESELEEEARRLENAEELAMGAGELHESLYAGEDSLSDRVSSLRGLLDRLAKLDPGLAKTARALEESYHALAETGRNLGDYASGLEFDPARLEELRQRQDLIFRLKRKYGPTLEDVLGTADRVGKELAELESASFDLKGLEELVGNTRKEFLGLVEALGAARQEAGRRLEEEVGGLLPELGLERGEFLVALNAVDDPGPGGGEQVEFLVSLNPGFDPGPLSRIASGGEISRVMLALKTILAGVDQIPTLIFDEVDAGIGGEIALQVGDKLKEVAANHQVFVITHLPQLASRAHHQFLVEKGEVDGLASTSVRELTQGERVREVARMLGGDPDSSASQNHARELLGLT